MRLRLNVLKKSWFHGALITCNNPLAPKGSGDWFLKHTLNLLLMGAEERK